MMLGKKCEFVLFLFLAICAIGCNGAAPKSVDIDGKELTAVTLQLNWFPESEHGGFFAAQTEGFFREAGLDVTLAPGGPNAPVIQGVATERMQFAVATADQVLLGRAEGANTVALFAAMQQSPRCIMVHADSGIESFEQLQNVTLAVGVGKPFVAYLESKVPLTGVTMVPYSGGSMALFLGDKRYAQQAYVFSEPYIAESQGARVRSLMLSDIGYNPYSSVLITSEKMVRERPELVRKMVQAVQRGWDHYLKSPQSANALIHKVNPEIELGALAFGAKAEQALCRPEGDGANELGGMTLARWTELRDQLAALKLLDGSQVDPAKAFDDSFLSSP